MYKSDINNKKNANNSAVVGFVISALLCLSNNVYCQEKLIVMTEEATPLSMTKDGGKTIYGASADKVHELLHRAHITYEMQTTSWNRALELARTQTDTCVFSAARTPEREAHFNWIGPIAKGDWVIVGSTEKFGKITQLAQIKSANIGVYMGDAVSEYLSQRGYHVMTSYSDEITIRNLMIGRLDYWASDSDEASAIITKGNLKEKLRILFTFASSDYFIACNPNINAELIEKMKARLAEMRDDGTTAKIDAKYQNPP
jgi:polar amino acid transport system substrate-binding protein